ncbi:osmotically inducible protein OsmC [Pseudomonas fluorescens]
MNFAQPSILRTQATENHEGATLAPDFEEAQMSIKKKASAHWVGDLKTGLGSISTETGVLKDAPYGFKARFEGGPGTNPEELIGAAHAGCFSMAFSMILGEAGLKADAIDTQAEVTLDQVDGGFAITAVHLTLKAKIPGASQQQFEELSKKAKVGCPVSKVLNAKITLDATLVG